MTQGQLVLLILTIIYIGYTVGYLISYGSPYKHAITHSFSTAFVGITLPYAVLLLFLILIGFIINHWEIPL